MPEEIQTIKLSDLKTLSDKLHEVGNIYNRASQGKTGWLFWEAAGHIEDVISYLEEDEAKIAEIEIHE